MIRTRHFTIGLLMAAAMSSAATAQARVLTVRPESRVLLEGSSNVVDWTCRTSAFEATILVDSTFDAAPVLLAKPISKVAVRIPVTSLKCGHNRMNQDLYTTLRAAQYPDIRYVLSSYTVTPTSDPAVFAAMTVGDITVAGVTKRVEVPIVAQRWQEGARGHGTVKLRMTDFGVKPPVALLGAIRTKNDIAVTFDVVLDRSMMVALTRAPAVTGASRGALE